jgi:predicted glycogen debranching enzyme
MDLPELTYPKELIARFSEGIAQEWLVTNGLGSYASSSLLGINTRKYHGLLVAALNPPGERTVCLSKLDEDLIIDGSVFRLGSNEFRDVIFPQGYKFILEFKLDPYPQYLYAVGNVTVKKSICMPRSKNAVAVIYEVSNSNASTSKLRIYPILTCRYYHTVIDRKKANLNFTQESKETSLKLTFKHPDVSIACRITDGKFFPGLNWVERLHYRDEATRVEADFDDCFQPGYYEVAIPAQSNAKCAITCAASHSSVDAAQILDSIGETANDINTAFLIELHNKKNLLDYFYNLHPEVPKSEWLNWILLAADSFLVQNNSGRKDVIAGYHWFEPWGRDTFISLPGLTLVTGRFDEAKAILKTFIAYLKGGLLPNFVADKTGDLAYNTVDGTLWYINAVLQYVKYTGDFEFVKSNLWAGLQTIVNYHLRGTMFGIRLDEDGLLSHGPQLTWMDASVDGFEVTPRAGKAVEIQALWYNTLRIMELLASKFREDALEQQYSDLAEKTRRSFNNKFWNPNCSCLFDVLEQKSIDPSIRPNQIFAVSLEYSMLNRDSSRKVVEVVTKELATPYGLRTLSLHDPKFVGKCFGDRRSRDTAYHNGTIWPWLLGPFVSAYLKVNDYSDNSRKEIMEQFILPFFTEGISKGGLGTINEIYDCDPPNEPRGCISQAWSVAEPLRAYVEDVLGIKPKN